MIFLFEKGMLKYNRQEASLLRHLNTSSGLRDFHTYTSDISQWDLCLANYISSRMILSWPHQVIHAQDSNVNACIS